MIRIERDRQKEPRRVVREPGEVYGSEAWRGRTLLSALRGYLRGRRDWRAIGQQRERKQ